MSRYSPITADMQHVLDVLVQVKASSTRHVTQGDVLRALHGIVPPDAVCDALEALHDAALISTMRHTRDGVTQTVYWPTGFKPLVPCQIPTTPPEPSMTLADKILNAIVQHGPLVRAGIIKHTGVNPKSLEKLIEPLVDKKKVVTRNGYDAESGRNCKHWMTPDQASAWDEQAKASSAEPASTPVVATPGAPIQAEDTATLYSRLRDQADEVDRLRRQVHDLTNDNAGMRMVLQGLAMRYGATTLDTVPDYIADQMGTLNRYLEESTTQLLQIFRALDVTGYEQALEEIAHLHRLAEEVTDSRTNTAYGVFVEPVDMHWHTDIGNAQEEAKEWLDEAEEGTVHIIARVATGRKSVVWS